MDNVKVFTALSLKDQALLLLLCIADLYSSREYLVYTLSGLGRTGDEGVTLLLGQKPLRLIVGDVVEVSCLAEVGFGPNEDDFRSLTVVLDLTNPLLGQIDE